MKLRYFTRRVYGVPRHYVLDTKEKVLALASLMGRTTLNKEDLKSLETIGFKTEEVLDPQEDLKQK